jgi:hypothetical protein
MPGQIPNVLRAMRRPGADCREGANRLLHGGCYWWQGAVTRSGTCIDAAIIHARVE